MRLTHTGTQEIETERLRLRRFVIEDADEVFRKWAGDENVTRYLTWERHKSAAQTKTWLFEVIAGYERDDKYCWGIELKETGGLIGAAVIDIMNERRRSVTGGYCLSERFWGCGYAAETLRAITDYMFYDVNVNRIELFHSVNKTLGQRAPPNKLGKRLQPPDFDAQFA